MPPIPPPTKKSDVPVIPVKQVEPLDSGLSRAMDELLKVEIPQLDEHKFVRDFLPLFCNEGKEFPIEYWLLVAGNAHTPVDIVRGKEVLFRVPPLLLDVTMKNIPGGSRVSINQIIHDAQLKYNYVPAMGDAHIQHYLIDRIAKNTPTRDAVDAWNKIFERYGKPLIVLPGEEPATKAEGSAGNGNNSDFDEFAEL